MSNTAIPQRDQVKWPDKVSRLTHLINEQLIANDIGKLKSAELATRLVIGICNEFGGAAWYLPKGDRMKNEDRNLSIREEFNGTNIEELARKHGLSSVTIYSIVNED